MAAITKAGGIVKAGAGILPSAVSFGAFLAGVVSSQLAGVTPLLTTVLMMICGVTAVVFRNVIADVVRRGTKSFIHETALMIGPRAIVLWGIGAIICGLVVAIY